MPWVIGQSMQDARLVVLNFFYKQLILNKNIFFVNWHSACDSRGDAADLNELQIID
jgi:hypothetical protein